MMHSFFSMSEDCKVSFQLGDSQGSSFVAGVLLEYDAFLTRLTMATSGLRVPLHGAEGEMRKGERTAFAASHQARYSRTHSALDSRLISLERMACSTKATRPDAPATNQALTDATVTWQAVFIQPYLLSPWQIAIL